MVITAFPRISPPSERTIYRVLGEVAGSEWAKVTMGSKSRSALEPHPGEYLSEGFLDLVQMDHTKGDVIACTVRNWGSRGSPSSSISTRVASWAIMSVSANRWRHDLPELLTAYLIVAQRSEARGEPLAGQRRTRDPCEDLEDWK